MIKRFLVVAGVVLFASCAKEETTDKGNENLPIVLSATFSNEADGSASQIQSKATATAFEGGDELGLFVAKSGMEVQSEGNLVNNHKMVVGDDGVIKGASTAVYYPTQQGTSSLFKTNLYSYYPYQSGDATADALGVLVGIRTDQTDFSYLKRSDLCYGSVHDIAPSKAAQPLSFKHSFSQVRVNVTLYAGCPSIKQLRLINIKDSATLNIQSGALTLKSHTAEVLTYPNSSNSPTSFTAIIPAQILAGACIAIDLVDPSDPTDLDKGQTYIYNAVNPINLAQSATNTLNLSINEKGVITLNGEPTISAWNSKPISSSDVSQATDNTFTFYWSPAITDFNKANKAFITLTNPTTAITKRFEVTSFVVDPLSSAANAIYRFSLPASTTQSVGYPATIDKFELFNSTTLIHTLTDYYGRTITKQGDHTFGTVTSIKTDISEWLNVSGYGDSRKITVTTTGNVDWTASASGTGLSVSPTTGKSGQTATISWIENTNGALVTTLRAANVTFTTTPIGVSTTLATTQLGITPPANSVRIAGLWWSTINIGATIPQGYGNLLTSYQALTACPAGWQLPTAEEFLHLIDAGQSAWAQLGGINGRWFGPNASSANATTAIFLPAAGSTGGGIGSKGIYRANIAGLSFTSTEEKLIGLGENDGFSVRCVQD